MYACGGMSSSVRRAKRRKLPARRVTFVAIGPVINVYFDDKLVEQISFGEALSFMAHLGALANRLNALQMRAPKRPSPTMQRREATEAESIAVHASPRYAAMLSAAKAGARGSALYGPNRPMTLPGEHHAGSVSFPAAQAQVRAAIKKTRTKRKKANR